MKIKEIRYRLFALVILSSVALLAHSCTDDNEDLLPPNYPGTDTANERQYESYLGYYTLTGDLSDGSGTVSYNVTVEPKVWGSSYTVYGWSTSSMGFIYPLEMRLNYSNNDYTVSISTGQNLGTLTDKGVTYNVYTVWRISDLFVQPLTYDGSISGKMSNGVIKFTPSVEGQSFMYALESNGSLMIRTNESNSILNPVLTKLETEEPYYADGDEITFQNHSRGDGMTILFLGDGYVEDYDFARRGTFYSDVNSSISALFGVEPYASFRNYFDITAIATYSEERGVSSESSGLVRNTAFSSGYTDALFSSSVYVDEGKLLNYVSDKIDISDAERIIIIILLNEDYYGGTTYIYHEKTYPNIAIIPATERQIYFGDIVKHEAGGHAFGLLADEYIYYDEEIPATERLRIEGYMEHGFGANITFESRANAPWAKYYSLPGYEAVGYYEGSYQYRYGIWRCEELSCMDNLYDYFAASSREAIYSKIMRLAGEEYDFDTFLEYDTRNIEIEEPDEPEEDDSIEDEEELVASGEYEGRYVTAGYVTVSVNSEMDGSSSASDAESASASGSEGVSGSVLGSSSAGVSVGDAESASASDGSRSVDSESVDGENSSENGGVGGISIIRKSGSKSSGCVEFK